MADEKPAEIRHQIDETSQDLKSKVEQLEEQVIGTVKGATDAVGDTVERVKDSVSETIENVKETVESTVKSIRHAFDLSYQTRHHPWPMVGLSVLAGFMTGKMLPSAGRGRRRAEISSSNGFRQAIPPSPAPAAPASAPASQAAPEGPGLFSRLLGPFEGEVRKVKEMAIGTIVGFVRDLVKRAVPEGLAPKVDHLMDSVTSKLGGEVISTEDLHSRMGGTRY